MQNTKLTDWLKTVPRWQIAGAAILLLLGGYWWLRPGAKTNHGSSFAARRGSLHISVVENGSIEAQESQEVRSEVKGYQGVKILSIVEEGYHVSEEDVRTNKVLVELDSSEIKKNLTTSDIDFQARQAGLTEAQQGYEIQLAQNKSDVKSAEQKAKFARLDLEKFLGDQVTGDITKQLGLDDKYAKLVAINDVDPALDTDRPPVTTAAAPAPTTPPAASGAPAPVSAATNGVTQLVAELKTGATVTDAKPVGVVNPLPVVASAGTNGTPAAPASSPPDVQEAWNRTDSLTIDFSKYAKVELLGDGEAQQKLREAQDAMLLSEKEKKSNKTKLEGTERLYLKEFVTKTEVETSRLEYEQVDLKVKKSGTALNLFIKYEFPKQAEELLSKYEEALRMLERTRKEAVSKLAQARAKLKSAEQQYRILEQQRKDLQDQIDKCTIRAKKPGLVIYGGSGEGMYWGGEERIREGALIRERQPIITIPNMTRMAIKVKIHESHIKKIKKGMKARIRVDAQADKQLQGEVTKVAVLPDSQNRWMNPDLKVYSTTISIDGTHDWLKPGMSAKVEVMVTELKDVVYVPIQAATPSGKELVCFVLKGGKPDRRVVETGEYSDEFIEIKKGVKEGEVVLLRSPEGGKRGEDDKPGVTTEKDKKPTPAKAPAAAPPAAVPGPRPS